MENPLYKLHKLDDLKVNKRYSFHLNDNDIVRGTFDGEALRRLNALSDDSNYDPRFRVSNYSINGGPQVSDDIKLLWASDISKVTNYDLGLIPELSDKVGEYLGGRNRKKRTRRKKTRSKKRRQRKTRTKKRRVKKTRSRK